MTTEHIPTHEQHVLAAIEDKARTLFATTHDVDEAAALRNELLERITEAADDARQNIKDRSRRDNADR